MKDNPLFNCDAVLHFDPIDLENPDIEPDASAQELGDAFELLQPVIGTAVNTMAMAWSDHDGGLWAYVASPDRRVGFWYPLDCDTYAVEKPDIGFVHSHMPATAFGAGLTVAALRSFIEFHAEVRFAKSPNALDDVEFAEFQTLYDELRDFVLDLAQDDLLDGESFLGFIDE